MFNFWLNVIYKGDLLAKSFFERDYVFRCKQVFDIALYQYQYFEIQRDRQYFWFDDLIGDDQKFFQSVVDLQMKLTLPIVTWQEFARKKNIFQRTCVNGERLFENFDDLIWCFFVMGILHGIGHTPHDQEYFEIFEPENADQVRQYAEKYYPKLESLGIKFHHFDTDRFLPKDLLGPGK